MAEERDNQMHPAQAVDVAERMTRAGVPLTIRAAGPEDVACLADIYAHLTAQDMRFRFRGSIERLSAEDLLDLVDRDAGMTSYLAFSENLPVACATLIHDRGRNSAEVILAVRPEWKGHGVSWTLLEYVIDRATAAGLKRMTSHELGEDREAVNLQREMGFVARLTSADPVALSMDKVLNR